MLHPAERRLRQAERLRGDDHHSELDVPVVLRGLRKSLLEQQTIDTFIHNGRGVFGSDFGSCSFVIRNYLASSISRELIGGCSRSRAAWRAMRNWSSGFIRLTALITISNRLSQDTGQPVAYWVVDRMRHAFRNAVPLERLLSHVRAFDSDNDRFLRRWFEVAMHESDLVSTANR